MVEELSKCEKPGEEKDKLAQNAFDKELGNVFVVTRQADDDERLKSVQVMLA